jgi:hypothetical protein
MEIGRNRHLPPLKVLKNQGFDGGDPGMTRTCDLRFRKPSLYPDELRDRIDFAKQFLSG